jgi:CheY-like chemotaxis protein
MTKPLALVFYESLLPGSQLVNRLQDLGYRVVTSSESAGLAALARELRPLLLIIDLTGQQPGFCDVIREIKQASDTGHIPVLAFSRDGESDLRTAAHSCGAALVTGDVAILAHLPQLLNQVLEVDQ